jgi:hypothetical protein
MSLSPPRINTQTAAPPAPLPNRTAPTIRSQDETSERSQTDRRRKGRRGLRIDLQPGVRLGSGSGLNIPIR